MRFYQLWIKLLVSENEPCDVFSKAIAHSAQAGLVL